MASEAWEFYQIHGTDSVRFLKGEISRALMDEDDRLAMRLDEVLHDVERFIERDGRTSGLYR